MLVLIPTGSETLLDIHCSSCEVCWIVLKENYVDFRILKEKPAMILPIVFHAWKEILKILPETARQVPWQDISNSIKVLR